MADFSQFREGGPSGSLVSPKAGVQDNSTATLLGSLSQIAQTGVSILSDQKKADVKSSADLAKRTYLSDLTSITQAQATGQLPKNQAQAMLRKRYQQGLASGELDAESLRTLTSDFLDVGAIVKEGTDEEKQRARLANAALDAGWVKPGMTPEEQSVAIQSYQDFQVSGDRLKRASEEANLSDAQRKRMSRNALGEMSATYSTKFKTDAQGTLDALARGEVTPEMAVQELDTQWATIQEITASLSADAGGDYASAIVKPMQSIYQNSLKVATGELSKEIYQNQVAKDLAMATANMSGDPKVARIMALSKMLPNADVLLSEQITEIVADKLGKNSQTEGRVADLTDPQDEEENRTYMGIVKDGIKSLQSGKAIDPEETDVEVQTNLINVIKGVAQYGAQVDQPSELNSVLNLIADTSTGQYLANKGGVPSDIAAEAEIVFTEAYKEPAIQALLKEFKTSTTTIDSSFPGASVTVRQNTAEKILPVFSGSGVSFVLLDADPKFRKAMGVKVKQLNKDVAPVLNRLVRIDAHLSGSTDYAKTYRENYEELFTPEEPEVDLSKDKTVPNDNTLLDRQLDSSYVAKLEELKRQGATREDAERVFSFLGLTDRGGAADVKAAIESTFGDS